MHILHWATVAACYSMFVILCVRCCRNTSFDFDVAYIMCFISSICENNCSLSAMFLLFSVRTSNALPTPFGRTIQHAKNMYKFTEVRKARAPSPPSVKTATSSSSTNDKIYLQLTQDDKLYTNDSSYCWGAQSSAKPQQSDELELYITVIFSSSAKGTFVENISLDAVFFVNCE